MVTKEEEKAIRKSQNKFLKDKRAEWERENEALLKRRDRLIHEGKSEEAVNEELCEAFECTTTRIRNVVRRAMGIKSPGFQALHEASVLEQIEKLGLEIAEAKAECDNEIIRCDEAEDEGDKWISVKLSKSDRHGDTTESMAIPEYRQLMLSRKLKYGDYYFSNIRAMVSGNVVNINNANQIRDMSEADLDKMINSYKTKGDV